MSYADLVAVATVGVSRRPLPVSGLAGPAAAYAGLLDRDDPAVAALDAAALLVSSYRAGALPAEGVTPPAPADPDTAPELPARAVNALALPWAADPTLLADHALLADLLTAAASRGYLAPAPLLPALLDAAVKDRNTRPAVAAVLGARGRWLAGHRADWRQAIEAFAPGVPDDPAVWQTGSRGERRAYLTMLRDQDPVAARELLAASWSEETGEDRADLLAVLARGLGAADEEFIERALDDPKASVRAAAQILLTRLPGSAHLRRAALRAAPLLRVERSGLRHRLAASLPGGVDGTALRDGISPTPPALAIGARAWLLTQLIAAAPLTEWCTRSGMDPQQLVSLPVTGDLAVDVHAGWRLATVRQASQAWAQALLAARPVAGADRPPAAWPPDHQLAAILPPEAQADRATALLTKQGGVAGVTAALTCPAPWPQTLADAVMAVLEQAFATGRWSGSPETLLLAAARKLPVDGPHDYASALERMARSQSCPPRWAVRLRRSAHAFALRRAFLEEIR